MKSFLSKQKFENNLELAIEAFKKTGLHTSERLENNVYNSERMKDIIQAFRYWDKLKVGILPEKPKKIFRGIIYLPKALNKCDLQYL